MQNPICIVALGLALVLSSPQVKNELSSKQSSEAYERLKKLEGTWKGVSKRGRQCTLTYAVIARGSAVQESYSDTDNNRMLTVYYLEDGQLMLRHYSVAKNQPRMRAVSYDHSSGDLRFEFVDADNFAGNDGHMHEITLQFTDPNNLVNCARYFKGDTFLFKESTSYTRVPTRQAKS